MDNRAALQLEVSTSPVPPGLVAYVDGLPAGWTRVMPRHEVRGVLANRALRRVLAGDDDGNVAILRPDRDEQRRQAGGVR